MDVIKSKLQRNRDSIDKIDRELVQLFCERAKFSIQKEQYDPGCEIEMINQLVALNPGPLSENALRAIYKELIFAELGKDFVRPEVNDSATVAAIDKNIVQLLSERVQQACEIGKIKHANGADYYDPTREAQVMAKIVKLNSGPISNAALQAIYREIISGSIALEKKLAIAYLGPEATYTHQAALSKFGVSLGFRAKKTIPDVFADVECGDADYGVIPIENSTEGVVFHSMDMLAESDLHICSQIYLPIRHCLVSNSPLAEIQEVRSKDQALGQCREWLHTHLSGISLVDVVSTAEAVRHAKTHDGVAAVASELSAQHYGVRVRVRDIQDRDDNVTRFLVVGKIRATSLGEGRDKTSLVITLQDECGALERALHAFSSRGINLSKIESRPSRKKAWDYVFFIDLIGHYRDEHVQAALIELKENCAFVKWLGSYPNEG
jgi:chorismate mutase/prephenate dehydratase